MKQTKNNNEQSKFHNEPQKQKEMKKFYSKINHFVLHVKSFAITICSISFVRPYMD